MMNLFSYTKATTATGAAAIATRENAKFIAGGTNLLDLMKKGVVQTDKLIDITGLPLQNISVVNNSLQIGALVLNSAVSENIQVQQQQPLLAQAINAGASAQIRNMATVGGNLLQRTRCPYFYNQDTPCNKRQPGSGCSALGGYNRMHAVLGASDACIAVHPSDMCVGLATLDATVVVTNGKTEKKIPFAQFHKLPGNTPHLDTVLQKGELITAVTVPANNYRNKVHYLKIRDRSSYAFALVSAAVALDIKNDVVQKAAIALGGVAHKPWRAAAAESFLVGKKVSEDIFTQAGNLAIQGAKGYGYNNFKLKMAPAAVTQALITAAQKA